MNDEMKKLNEEMKSIKHQSFNGIRWYYEVEANGTYSTLESVLEEQRSKIYTDGASRQSTSAH